MGTSRPCTIQSATGKAATKTPCRTKQPLSRPEADVAGISLTPEVVYGDTDEDPNRDDQRDANEADPDEHV